MFDAPGLLVSVRCAAEASAALEGGAALIDVKEPATRPLGRAAVSTIAEVLAVVAGRCPVSAALGELIDDRGEGVPAGLSYVKWGLAGFGSDPAWRTMLGERRGRTARSTQIVGVAYADWQCARSPCVEDVICLARDPARALRDPWDPFVGGVVLIDTHCKDAPGPGKRQPTLLDWLPVREIRHLCERCHRAGVRIALAGSLGPAEIAELMPVRPDWIAVRAAACEGGRDGVVSTLKVRELVAVIRQSARLATAAG